MPKAKFITVFPEAVLLVLSQWHGHLYRWARQRGSRATAPFLTPAAGRGRVLPVHMHRPPFSSVVVPTQSPVDSFLVSLIIATLTL